MVQVATARVVATPVAVAVAVVGEQPVRPLPMGAEQTGDYMAAEAVALLERVPQTVLLQVLEAVAQSVSSGPEQPANSHQPAPAIFNQEQS